MIISFVVLTAVATMLRVTSLGRQMRALADNFDLAETTGIDTGRVVLKTWLLAGGLAGLAGVLVVAATGSLTPNTGFYLLLPLFAAVVLGGIGNAYGALAGGLVIGLTQEWSTLVVESQWKVAVSFLVLIIVLHRAPAGHLRTGAHAVIELPVAVTFDFLTAWDFWIGVGILAGIYGIFTLGLQLNVGYTGVLNFGQAGFMAIGAYAAIIFVVELGWSYWLALPASALLTIIVGLLIGLPSLRLRADYFAIATIAFSEIVRDVAQNARDLTGGNQGTINLELENDRFFTDPWFDVSDWIQENLLDPIGLSGQEFGDLPLFLVVWVTLGLLAVGLHFLVRSPWGRVLRAVREDEDAARALGKNAFSYKLQSLAVAAVLGAISGWFLAFNLESVSQVAFEPLYTFLGFGALVLGGLASFGGVLVGSVLLWTLLEGFRFLDLPLSADKVSALRFIIVGVILILLMAFRPQGIFGKREEMVLGE